MTSHIKFIFFLLHVLLFNSCSHYYYAPDEANVLKLSEAKDIKVSISGNNDSENSEEHQLKHINLQVGYSPIKHLGIFSSHFRMNGKHQADGIIRKKGNGHLTNIGVGGYYFVKTKSLMDKVVKYDVGVPSGFLFDLYGGYGKGRIYNFYEKGGNSELNIQKYFVQGGVHWNGTALGASCVYKIGGLNYSGGVINFPIDTNDTQSLIYITENRTLPFREASFHFYAGIKHARVYLNFSIIANEFDRKFSPRENLASLGLVMEIDEIFRSIKQKKG